MQNLNPISVIKDDHIVKDVYLSDLPSWQAEGYEIYDPLSPVVIGSSSTTAPKKKATKSTPVESEQS